MKLKHSGLANVAGRPRSGEPCEQGAVKRQGVTKGGVQGVREHKALPTGRTAGRALRAYRSPSLDSPYRISSASTIYFIAHLSAARNSNHRGNLALRQLVLNGLGEIDKAWLMLLQDGCDISH
jgi:hypothetical protein